MNFLWKNRKENMNRISKALILIVILSSLAMIEGCRSYAESTPMEFLEGNNVENYERVFDFKVPDDVNVINSVVVAYPWRLGVVTTDDWEFEIIAPKLWIDDLITRMHLRKSDGDQVNSDCIQRRKQKPIRAWYAPNSISSYDLYYLYLTSIPYVHLLVEKKALNDGRYRLFISKH